MKTISIDIETFSSVDLAKSGVYRYAESPDFEVLLFGYSVDGSAVSVVDLASGEKIPPYILSALEDETVIKCAFNANFERICLSRLLGYETGRYLSPVSWHCTMVWSAYMGLPLSLQGCGAVLRLDRQKLTEGKELIRYFCVPCQPTKANGGRTRNRPGDAPEKWARFKIYNARDVETEAEIQQKLSRFPVPEEIWDEYCIDQKINDTGVALDRTLVREAIAMDGVSGHELSDAMKSLTALENPNSVSQMKAWLAANGLHTDTLGKKTVAELLKTAPERLREVLLLRQQLCRHQHDDFLLVKIADLHAGQRFGKTRNGQVDVLVDEAFVEGFICPLQKAHLNVWIRGLEGRDIVRHDGMAPGKVDPDEQLAPLVVGQVIELVPHGLVISVDLGSVAEKYLSGIGELQRIAADDQFAGQLFFHSRDVRAQGLLGDVQLLRRVCADLQERLQRYGGCGRLRRRRCLRGDPERHRPFCVQQ